MRLLQEECEKEALLPQAIQDVRKGLPGQDAPPPPGPPDDDMMPSEAPKRWRDPSWSALRVRERACEAHAAPP